MATILSLRDLAAALNGSGKQFSVAWDNGVVLTTGAAYGESPLLLTRIPAAATQNLLGLTVTVDGGARAVDAALIDGNYYVTSGSLGKLLDMETADALHDGVLTLTTK